MWTCLAKQHTHGLHADYRLLLNSMRMLCTQKQIKGVGRWEGGFGPFVPILMLNLPRRVRVLGGGNLEYNDRYFCTGCNCNSNSFLFTKPQWLGRGFTAAATRTATVGTDTREAAKEEEKEVRCG